MTAARARSSGMQSRLSMEPRDTRNMQHLSSHVSAGTATALALTQLPKYLPYQSPWGNEDLRVSQSQLQLQPRPQPPLMADGVAAPRFPMPSGWCTNSLPAEQAEPCDVPVSGELSTVASRALAQHPYPQIAARLMHAFPPLPPKNDSPPPGLILKAVRRVNSSSARSNEKQPRPSRQNSRGSNVEDETVLPRPRASTRLGTRTPQPGTGRSSPREIGLSRRASSSASSASRRHTFGILPDSPTNSGSSTLDKAPSSGGASPSRRRPLALSENSSPQATLGPLGESGSPKSLPVVAMSSGWGPCLASMPGAKRKAANREISLLRSVFEGRPPVLYFQYEPRCGAPERDMSRVLREELSSEGFEGGLPKMYFCHDKTKDVHEYNAMLNTSKHGGLSRTSTNSSKWALFWGAHPSPELLRSFHRFQKANHFPASWHLGRKDLLWKNVYRMKRQFPKDFNITPVGFVLPDDFDAWMTARQQTPSALWIYKPANSSCGRGIKLIASNNSPTSDKKLSQKTGIIQRYVDRPMQINGYKFDLRVYVLVTSYDPLKVYLNAEGLVRLATEKYEHPTSSNIDHRTMHLTNYSVNKHADCYVKNNDGAKSPSAAKSVSSPVPGEESGEEDNSQGSAGKATRTVQEEPDDEEVGGEGGEDDDDESKQQDGTASTGASEATAFKWSFSQLRDYCAETNQDYKLIWDRIKDLIIKTLLSVEAQIVNTWHQGANYSTCGMPSSQVGPNQTCFEIYGFDVMLDENLRPWLLEVNTFPSLSSSSPFDKRVKTMLIADSLTLAGFHPFDHELLERAVKEDHVKRLQGLHQKHTSSVVRSHAINNIGAASLKSLGEAEWQLILDTHDEFMRRGQFERIYPTREAVDKYAPFFSAPRYSNAVLARWLQEGGERCFSPEGRSEIPTWVPRLTATTPC